MTRTSSLKLLFYRKDKRLLTSLASGFLLLVESVLRSVHVYLCTTDSCNSLSCMWFYWNKNGGVDWGWSYHWLKCEINFFDWYIVSFKIPYLYKTYGSCEHVSPPLISVIVRHSGSIMITLRSNYSYYYTIMMKSHELLLDNIRAWAWSPEQLTWNV